MAKLIYAMLQSLDGYTEDVHGDFGWGAPEEPSREDGAILHGEKEPLAASRSR